MISMMYLVLTAMLALNVSADIINGFTKLRHSMETSMASTSQRTEDIIEIFENANETNPGKYGDWWTIAQAVHVKCTEFYEYVENFKLEIANRVDGKHYTTMPEHLTGGTDTHQAHLYALGELGASGKTHAEELEDTMDEFREYVTSADAEVLVHKITVDQKFAHDWNLKVAMFNSLFNTDDVMGEDGETISWGVSLFNEMPAAAVVALLTKYQNDVRVAENDLINFFFSAAGQSDFVVNSVDALVLPVTGDYVIRGQQYQARIVSAMVDTNQVPRVFIDGVEYENGIYTINTSRPGPQEYCGYMLVGDDTTRYNFCGKYLVGEPAATVSNTDLNIIYRGYDNPFSISVPGFAADKLEVRCQGAKITRQKDLWIINPSDAIKDIAVIEVFAKDKDGKSLPMGKTEYRVKNLPKPDAYFEINGVPTEDVKIARSALLNPKNKIIASYGPDGLIQAKFTITSFQFKMPTGASYLIKGDHFDDRCLSMLRKLKQGNSITLQYIKAVGPDGKEVQLRPLPIELN